MFPSACVVLVSCSANSSLSRVILPTLHDHSYRVYALPYLTCPSVLLLCRRSIANCKRSDILTIMTIKETMLEKRTCAQYALRSARRANKAHQPPMDRHSLCPSRECVTATFSLRDWFVPMHPIDVVWSKNNALESSVGNNYRLLDISVNCILKQLSRQSSLRLICQCQHA